MCYQHFSLTERTCISLLLQYPDITQLDIARVLNRNASSISREINRNGGRDFYNLILGGCPSIPCSKKILKNFA